MHFYVHFFSEFVDSKPVKIFTGSITDSDVVSEACKGVDAVLHIA
jgi:nucleoside-diphosphate-sugar epimerase